ncbi:hypothetical protein D3C78_951300 [compost metagenome]
MSDLVRMGVLLGALALPAAVVAGENSPPVAGSSQYAQEEQAARAMLAKAVAHYRQEGDKALATFSRRGPFTVDNLYVYVVDAQGVLVASGGPSILLAGQDIGEAIGAEARAKLMSREGGEGHVGEIEYPFRDWTLDGKVVKKHTFYQWVGDHVIAVGYYMPRADSADARKLLDEAAKAVASEPEATFDAINKFDKRYYQGDLYVLVVDLQTKRFVAHGYNRRLLARDFASIKGPDGKVIGQPMLDIALNKGEGEFDYQWLNPVTKQNEPKHAYIRRVGNYLVAVGYYQPQ